MRTVLAGWPLKERYFTKEDVQSMGRVRRGSLFAAGVKRVEKVLGKFPRKVWNFTTTPKNWTITQVLWHLADQEANLYMRLRIAAAEPGHPVTAYDQNKWDKGLLYRKSDPEQAKAILLLLRKANADLVKRLGPSVWNKEVIHPEYGKRSFGHFVGMNIWHLDHHLAQMGRRYVEWKNKGK